MLVSLAAAYDLAPEEGLRGIGPAGENIPTTAEGLGERLATAISQVIGLLSVVAILWFVFQLVIAGIEIIRNSGNKEKIAQAQGKLTHSLLGLGIVLLATVGIALLGHIFNINFLDISENLQKIAL